MSAPLIGIVGYAQVGKDTAADALVEAGYTKRAFADALRALALDLNPILDNMHPITYKGALLECGYEDAKKHVPGFRQFLKDLGNGVRKHIGADAWIRAVLDTLDGPTVIADVRFVNEAQAIRDRGGKLLRVRRPGVGPESEFEAEVDWIVTDGAIDNDGPIAAFQRSVRAWAGRTFA